jgi:hypothetical protein
MHQHLHPHLIRLVRPQPKRPLRPAKVIVLETRRELRRETARPERPPTRPAA